VPLELQAVMIPPATKDMNSQLIFRIGVLLKVAPYPTVAAPFR
jgi:hypothetical protein